jgi:hypothetical protein
MAVGADASVVWEGIVELRVDDDTSADRDEVAWLTAAVPAQGRTVGSWVPSGFARYARILHPATVAVRPDSWERSTGCSPTTCWRSWKRISTIRSTAMAEGAVNEVVVASARGPGPPMNV